ncbi:MAG: HAD-IA family hydrolase [Syntrophobacterales bacterium]|jgi:putative hydrolase of the HAD superfamily|nr:HAD-IA family hydrolase [Syntrophobacterales bacterium]
MAFPWNDVTWVLLDMDGTLLDKHFDDYFWETLVPEEYARRQGLDLALARDLVFARYQREEGTLNWTDIDFWSRELELDIPALKEGIRHLIEVHPDTEDFLKFLRLKEKRVALVTNAHYKTLSLKMNHTGLLGYFDEVISSFDLGNPKEDIRFWEILHDRLGFDPRHALLVDDNADALASARSFGIKYPYFKAKSSSRQDAESHPEFPSIESFYELTE